MISLRLISVLLLFTLLITCSERKHRAIAAGIANGCGRHQEAIETEHFAGNPYDLRSPFADGLVDWRARAHCDSQNIAGRTGS